MRPAMFRGPGTGRGSVPPNEAGRSAFTSPEPQLIFSRVPCSTVSTKGDPSYSESGRVGRGKSCEVTVEPEAAARAAFYAPTTRLGNPVPTASAAISLGAF